MKIKSCLYFLGLSCLPIGIMALINIFYSFYFDYLYNLKSYILVLIISCSMGFFLIKIGKKNKDTIGIYEQLLLVFLVYSLISFLILIPFYLSNYDVSLINSYFESISGLTGTGFTVFENVKNLDGPLILWRSSSQWIGGLYFLIFLILLFSNKSFNFKMTQLTYTGESNFKSVENI